MVVAMEDEQDSEAEEETEQTELESERGTTVTTGLFRADL